MNPTGSPLDIAVQGNAWFAVKTPDGVAYTRDGRLHIDNSGALLTVNNYPILDAGGASMLLDPSAGAPAISQDGMISQDGRSIGAVGLYAIDATAKLTRYDNSAVLSDLPGSAVLDFTNNGVMQGMSEGSNVNAVLEMTKMIAVSRSFDSAGNAIQSTESSLQDAIKTSGRHIVKGRLEHAGSGAIAARGAGSRTEARSGARRRRHHRGRSLGLSRLRPVATCKTRRRRQHRRLGRAQPGEVVRIDAAGVTIKSFDTRVEAGVGDLAFRSRPMRLQPHRSWKGRVINALGAPVDGLGPLLQGPRSAPIDAEPPAAMTRDRVKQPIKSGVRVIDFFTPLCAGQRIGVFAGSGVGKSTVLAMLASSPGFDSVVIALVGERGREVREFLDDALGENRKLAVTVVSTADESAMMRRLAPKTAMAIAEYFRDQGESVLLIVDSITRFAHAAREVALAAGEPAVARGYAPSVFSELPKLLERAGPGGRRRFDHRDFFGAGRWRRSQRSGRRHHSRRPGRPYRARPRHRRSGALSRRQCSVLGLASRPSRVEQGAARAGDEIARDDRAISNPRAICG